MPFLSTLVRILIVFSSIFCGVFGVYYAFTCLGGLFRKRAITPGQRPKTRIAAVIAARNEAQVIGKLIDSLRAQDYPKGLYDIYVIPNNCTDDTAAVASAAGAKVLPCEVEVHAKGDALRFAFGKLSATGQYDAYCVFDADNLVSPNFFRCVNDACLAGYHAAQGFRDSKNPSDNWVSGAMSAFYWFMSRLFNESRARLGMSCQLNGTGFMVSDALIRRIGWDTHTLTEDLEYTALCALDGTRVGWMPEARVYDEQPLSFWVSVIQRRRWTAGSMQCLRRYVGRLVRKHSVASLDMAALFTGNLLGVIGLIPGIATVCDVAVRCYEDPMLIPLLIILGGLYYCGCALGALILYRMEGRLTRRSIPGILGFPIFLVTWMPINLYAIFTPAPVWKEIRHTQSYDKPGE